MTIDEAVALLRETREALYDPDDAVTCTCTCCTLTKRIDAALAAHDAEPDVEWREYGGRDEDASIDGAHCVLRYVGGSTGWHWDVTRGGTKLSLYDARAAAEKAARGGR